MLILTNRQNKEMNKNNKVIKDILQKPMNRKEFLQHSAAAVLFVAGGGAIVQSIAKNFMPSDRQLAVADGAGSPASQTSASSMGYGSTAYGGKMSAQ